jgi:hypothetical protein
MYRQYIYILYIYIYILVEMGVCEVAYRHLPPLLRHVLEHPQVHPTAAHTPHALPPAHITVEGGMHHHPGHHSRLSI